MYINLTKKAVLFLLTAVLLLSFAACTATDGGDSSAEVSENSAVSVSPDTSSPVSEEQPSGEPSDEESQVEEDPIHRTELLIPENMCFNIASGNNYDSKDTVYRIDQYGDSDKENRFKSRGKLTDGIFAADGTTSEIGGYGGNSLTVYMDLGDECTISYFETDCFGNNWGVADPAKTVVELCVSYNGKDYFSACKVSPSLGNAETYPAGEWTGCRYKYNFDKPITARYIKVIYKVSGEHIWTSEIVINGYSPEYLETLSREKIPCVFINTEDNDRFHKSTYHPCSITVFDPDGKYSVIYDTNSEVKVRGNSTSSGAKQPLNIRFSEKQDLLGMGSCKKWYLLANMYDKTQIRNKLAYGLAYSLDMEYIHQSTFVNLYVNGVYTGFYQLCESIGVGESRVDIDIENNEFLLEFEPWEGYSNPECIRSEIYGVLLGFNDPESPTAAQREYLAGLLRSVEAAMETHDYDKIAEYVDIDSFVDSYIIQEFFKEVDYQTSSTRFYVQDGKLYEGPVWDFDLSSGNCSSDYYREYNNIWTSNNSWEGIWCMGIWNKYLFNCPGFKEQVKQRYLELQPYLVNIYQDNELGKNQIDSLLGKYRDEIDRNYRIWSTEYVYSDLERVPTDGTYDSEITYLRSWFENRNSWLLEYFGLTTE